MTQWEDLVDKLSESTDITFRPAKQEDLEVLARLKVPPEIIAFYHKFEPEAYVELGEVRLWPIEHILEENTKYVPGADLHPHGYIVFASNLCGDAYCLDTNETDERGQVPVVLMAHDMFCEEDSAEDIKRLRKKVAENFEDFLRKFQAETLETEPLYTPE